MTRCPTLASSCRRDGARRHPHIPQKDCQVLQFALAGRRTDPALPCVPSKQP
ncbi:hypothetical protein E2C01_064711 [Portunus trituberculatus]|uniref:Uncharacterized protein n=1 Tax=Portunus trituberculatus TaxID=210409 RepID=A0A5B7HJW6_PORTR|nr:hypothetical protein [Portunus trituberculatus]